MFRIKMNDAPAPPPMGDMAPDPGMADPAALGGGSPDQGDSTDNGEDAGKVDQAVVLYMGSEFGPFECQHCSHWQDPNKCDIVKGDIDPQGCCNLYEPGSDHGSNQGPDLESPQEDMMESPQDEEAEGDQNGH